LGRYRGTETVLVTSGVNPNIFGGAIEAPTPPRRVESTGRGGGEGTAPSPEIFFDFGSPNGDLWCIIGAVFLQFS